MPDSEFVRAKRAAKTVCDHLCRVGQHYVSRNELAIRMDKKQGLCGRCIVKHTQRHPGDAVDVASYWTRDWPVGAIGPVGARRTWAAPPVDKAVPPNAPMG